MLLKEFLELMNVSQKEFCHHLKWPYARLNEIIHGRRGVTVDSAITIIEQPWVEIMIWFSYAVNKEHNNRK